MSELKAQIEKRLKELRYDCGLQRVYLRHAQGPRRWSGCQRRNPDKPDSWELYWENLQAKAQEERPKDVAAADARLAAFIAESRPIMGAEWPGTDHGRLCWSPFCGGLPIDQFYCQEAENHAGSHLGTGDGTGLEMMWPNSPLQEVTNEHEWHKLIAVCPHAASRFEERHSANICNVCGAKVSASSSASPRLSGEKEGSL